MQAETASIFGLIQALSPTRIAVAMLALALASCAGGRHVAQEQMQACWLTEAAPQSGLLACAPAALVAASVSECNEAVQAGTREFVACMVDRKLHPPLIIHAAVSFPSRRACTDLYPAELCPSLGQ
jgi:hypothetical protein